MLNGNFSFFSFAFIVSGALTFSSVSQTHHQNQLLALDKENNAIQTTIHTNLLVESYYETPLGSNNNLYSTNSIMASPARESLLIDNDEQRTGQCNRSSCNQLCCSMRNDGGANNNENCGKCFLSFWIIFRSYVYF